MGKRPFCECGFWRESESEMTKNRAHNVVGPARSYRLAVPERRRRHGSGDPRRVAVAERRRRHGCTDRGFADSAPATRWCPLILALILAVANLLSAAPCFAVIILEKGKTEPICGYLVSEDASRVVVKELLPNGETRERTFTRSNIE